ncbi:MAG TPA: AarF/ABC1/UbiB kinase family protein [Candidatus Paceibacterota bacterium]|nr:AarF/ABC1/UbiB kinase family protein [Verrucomicrobiota bacterium]HSA11115.1 AarF/ABC1/UbiB kinase family protein [Candidatus Paceibacterota bacterium]
MNWVQFGRLVHSIYSRGGKLPDLDWIESLGLLAVKLGQVHALRIDFLDREKCEHLARLYRRNAALPADDFLSLLRASAGAEFLDHFAEIEQTALASASVGQVHRAALRSGQSVVIKAVKRNLRSQFIADVASLKRLFRLATFVYPKIRQVGDPIGILGDIEEYTLSELDLRREAAGQQTLRSIYEQHRDTFDLSRLAFARVHEPLCNENVMVSDYIPGRSFDELLEAGDLRYETLLELFHIHGFFMFCIGTFHGDMHPGNVLRTGDQLCFIDTGYIGRVSPRLRHGLFEFFAALSEYDYPLCAAALNRMSGRELTAEAFEAFKQKFLELYADFEGRTVAQVSLTRKMMQTIKLGVHSGMTFDKGIFAIIRSLMYLDGMVLRCKPDAVLLRDMRRYLAEFGRRI